jgi:hypothetical protein
MCEVISPSAFVSLTGGGKQNKAKRKGENPENTWRGEKKHDGTVKKKKRGNPENPVQLMRSVRSKGLFVFTCADANPP